jgi:hypothetical protein
LANYKRGSSFENTISLLFTRAKFKTIINSKKYNFEIDILAKKFGKEICIECKDRIYTNVRSLIYEWDNKIKHIGVHKLIIAIEGMEVLQRDIDFADKLKIYILDRNELQRISLLDNETLSNELNLILELESIPLSKLITNFFYKFIKIFISTITLFGFLLYIIYLLIKRIF